MPLSSTSQSTPKKRILHLPVKRIYFEDINFGSKDFEFRKVTPYWKTRLEGRVFDEVHIKLGYPKADDYSRILIRPWQGYELRTITHPEFGPDPVLVFAICVRDTPFQ